MAKFIMKCGHTDNSTWQRGKEQVPYCVICSCDEIEREIKSPFDGLEGRMAICGQHKDISEKSIVPSRWDLPFFKYRPQEPYDAYYCGCWGWG